MNARRWFFSGMAVCLNIPVFVYAQQGLVPCGRVGQADCQTCHVVQLVSGVNAWLVGILAIVASIMFMIAGFRLVTSNGNPSVLQDAKSMIINVAIGFVIVLAAWLLLDLFMKSLLSDSEQGLGPWNQIACVDQPVAFTKSGKLDIQIEAGGSIGITSGSGNSVTALDCVQNPDGSFDCEDAEAKCTEDLNGTPTLNSSNAMQNTVTCTVQVIGGTSGAGGSCGVVTDSSNACHPSKLNCFGDANAASRVCNLESAGGNQSAMSGSDLCADGNSFSGGLWQINVLANHRLLPGCSGDFFTKSGSSAQGSCKVEKTNSNGVTYCAIRNCRITDFSMYKHCVDQARNPEINSAAACELYGDANGWRPWITSANKCGVN